MRVLKTSVMLAFALLTIAAVAWSQKKEMAQKKQVSDAEYTAKALSAAPKAIADGATVLRMGDDGNMKTIRKGTNGFACMVIETNKMCADANSMEFMEAVMKKTAPPEKMGVAYMLMGDDGASNTDPYATAKTADNHWVVTGPHIMLFGPGIKSLGYPETKDADPTKPYIMWAGTAYAHAMIPVGAKK